MASDYSTCAHTNRGARTQQGDLLVTGNIILNGNIVPNGAAQVSFGRVPGTVWVDTSVGLTISSGANATPNEPAGKLSIDLPTLAGLLSEYLDIPESSGGSGSVSAAALAAAIAPYLDGTEAINVPADTSGGTSGEPQGTGADGEYLSFVTQSGLENYVAGQLSLLDLSGEVSIATLAPAYDGETAYEEGDVISFGGKFYKRTSGSGAGESGVSPSDATNGATYWTEIVLSDEILNRIGGAGGATEIDFDSIEDYDLTKNYYEGDLVKYNGQYFRRKSFNSGVNGLDPSSVMIGMGVWEEIFPPPEMATVEYVDKQFSTGMFRGEWESTGTYKENDVVTSNGNYYRRTSASPGVNMGVWATYLWTQVDSPKESGFIKAFSVRFPKAFGEAFNDGIADVMTVPETYDNTETYSEGDKVRYNGSYYEKTTGQSTGVAPQIGAGWKSTTWPFGDAVNSALDGFAPVTFQVGTVYDNDIVYYSGKYYKANGMSAVDPVTRGWPETTLTGWIKDSISAAKGTQKRAIVNANGQQVDLSGNNGAISIAFDTATPNIVHEASITNGLTVSVFGQNIVEFDVIYSNEQAATALTWNGTAVTWISGSASNLTAGRHLLRFRIIPQLDMNVPGAILVEYLCELPASF